MSRKFALKRLTASDLTLFRWHFQHHPAGKQKAINLNAEILVGRLYPQLGEQSDLPRPRYPLDLYLLGPGLAPAQNLQRKILKQKKNWRLNGELIDSPDDDPERYNILVPGDFVLFEFSGGAVPSSAKGVLIAQKMPDDGAVHRELNRRYPEASMHLLLESDIRGVLNIAVPVAGHPLYDWVESESVEDAVLGGAAGLAGLNRRRAGRGMSPEDFIRSRQAAERTGVSGEEFVNDYLENLLETGEIESFEWTSSINAIAPFDFRLRLPGGEERVIDAKSTAGDFTNAIHLSLGELHRAVGGREPYDIYRLYNVTEDSAKLRIARDIGPALKAVLESANCMPAGATVDAVSVVPDMLPFSTDEIVLSVSGVDPDI